MVPSMDELPLDFVLVAPKRTGTTWAHAYLAASDQVFPLSGSQGDLRLRSPSRPGPGVYLSFVPLRSARTPPPGAVVSEVSPSYFRSPEVAARLQEATPGCRVVVTLRHPYRRLISAYYHRQQSGTIPPSMPLDEAVDTLPSLVEEGRYTTHLREWRERFGDDRVYVPLPRGTTPEPGTISPNGSLQPSGGPGPPGARETPWGPGRRRGAPAKPPGLPPGTADGRPTPGPKPLRARPPRDAARAPTVAHGRPSAPTGGPADPRSDEADPPRGGRDPARTRGPNARMGALRGRASSSSKAKPANWTDQIAWLSRSRIPALRRATRARRPPPRDHRRLAGTLAGPGPQRVQKHEEPPAHPTRLRAPFFRSPRRPRHARPRRLPTHPPRPSNAEDESSSRA